MFKKVFYCIVLENYGKDKGLSEFWFKYLITEALSFSFLSPAKAIFVPLIHLAGFIRSPLSSSKEHDFSYDASAYEYL